MRMKKVESPSKHLNLIDKAKKLINSPRKKQSQSKSKKFDSIDVS